MKARQGEALSLAGPRAAEAGCENGGVAAGGGMRQARAARAAPAAAVPARSLSRGRGGREKGRRDPFPPMLAGHMLGRVFHADCEPRAWAAGPASAALREMDARGGETIVEGHGLQPLQRPSGKWDARGATKRFIFAPPQGLLAAHGRTSIPRKGLDSGPLERPLKKPRSGFRILPPPRACAPPAGSPSFPQPGRWRIAR